MRDLFLRFEDAAAWDAATVERDPGLVEIDVVGTIERLAKNGELVPLPGHHVNLRCTDDRDLSAIEEYQVFPTKPSRVWL